MNFTRPTPPADPAQRERIGRLVRYRTPPDPDTGFAVGVMHDGVIAAGRVDGTPFEPGQTYRMLGRWADHERFGWQFNWTTYVVQEPTGLAGVVKYLTKLCDGIGEKRATALYDAYGGDAVKTLRLNPEAVAAAGIIPLDVAKDSAKSLAAAADLEETKLALFDLFSGRGFWADALIKEAVAKWGAKAPKVIRRNPFAMMVAEMTSCGFKRCDKLWTELKLPPLRLKRQMLCGWNELHTDTTGHTWMPIESAVRAVKQSVGDGSRPQRAVRLGIRAKWLRHYRDADGKLWLAEADRATNEQAIATQITRLIRYGTNNWPVVGELEGRGPSDHQREKLRATTSECVGILAGTPGTGKTFTAAYLMQAIMDLHGADHIAVVAPTGKAAVRMTQSIKAAGLNITATTIHRLLGLGKASAAKGEKPMFNEFNALPYKFIFVDETSMADTDIMAHLLRACSVGTHVLFIGDPYQLPPVGHGAPLRDLIAAGVPCGELTEIRRNAGLIVHACAAIKDGRKFADAQKFNPDTGDNLRFMDVTTDRVKERLAAVLDRCKQTGTFDPIWQTQVIVGVNDRGELSRNALNTWLQSLLNADGKVVGKNPFRVGDKIICLKNQSLPAAYAVNIRGSDGTDPADYDDARDEWNAKIEVYVANGELGRVHAVNDKFTIARFSEGEHCVRIKMDKAKANGRGDEEPAAGDGQEKGRAGMFDLGYAITVHKAQGSEAPCVIVIADEQSGRVASREWWYTAISRASRLCIVIGSRAVMEKQARKPSLTRRKTFLAEKVREGLSLCQTAAS